MTKMGEKKHPLFAVINREVKRIKENPAYRFMLCAGPLTGILLLFFIFRQGAARDLPLAVVDQDQSDMSVKIVNALGAAPDVEVVMKVPDFFAAKEMLKRGKVEAIIVLPENLEKSVFMGVKADLPVYVNGTNILTSGLIQRSVLTTLRTISGGVQLKKLMLAGKNKEEAMARVVPVNLHKHVLFNPYTNYNYFLNSGMLYVMLYLFVLLSSIYTFGNELKTSTGRELLQTSNNSVRLAVAGKMVPYTVIFTGVALFINLLLYKVEGMPLKGNFWVIFWGQFVTIITYQLMGLIFVGITINLRLALSLASAYSMMGITFSGLTFPLEGMPLIAKWFAKIFPFTWWEKIMISQSLRGAPIKEALPYMCYILIFMLISLVFLAVYKMYLQNPKYWGKK